MIYRINKHGSPRVHRVERIRQGWSCDCKAYQYRGTCSHVRFARALHLRGSGSHEDPYVMEIPQ